MATTGFEAAGEEDLTKLDFSRIKNKLYGRSSELSIVEDAYERVLQCSSACDCNSSCCSSSSNARATVKAAPNNGCPENDCNTADSRHPVHRQQEEEEASYSETNDLVENDENDANSDSYSSSLSSSEMVLISGSSGTGKSSLVEHLRRRTTTTTLLNNPPPQCAGDNCSSNPHCKSCTRAKRRYFVSGKFDQMCRSEPYSAILMAFDQLCDLILQDLTTPQGARSEIGQAIQIIIIGFVFGGEGGESSNSAFAKIMPKLQRIVGKENNNKKHVESMTRCWDSHDDGNNGKTNSLSSFHSLDSITTTPEQEVGRKFEAQNRLHFAFRALVRAICSYCSILVLFIDDLQWADEPSLNLLTSILTDSQSQNLLFIGTYRCDDDECEEGEAETTSSYVYDDELTKNKKDHRDDPLAVSLRRIEELHVGTITRIHLTNLDKESVNSLISDLLRIDEEKTNSLTDIVYHMTRGNVFFVVKFLRTLQEENLLRFSFLTLKWTWADAEEIQSKVTITDNVATLMTHRIRRMSRDVQAVLMMAACLGCRFNVELLELTLIAWQEELSNASNATEERRHYEEGGWPMIKDLLAIQTLAKDNLVPSLDRALDEGLVEKAPEMGSATAYKFAHDRIQCAAYSMLPDGLERDILHTRIGERMWRRLSSSSKDKEKDGEWMCFLIANQLNHGVDYITNPGKRAKFARLNLRVSRAAIAASAFLPAAEYASFGRKWLSRTDSWETNYDASLELFTISAEMEYCIGNFEKSRSVIDMVLTNARNLHDKIQTYTILVDSLKTQQKFKDAMDVGLHVLAMLGEKFPRRVRRLDVVKDVMKTKRMLRKMTDNMLLTLPSMRNKDKLAAMQMIRRVTACAFFLGSKLCPLLILRMVQLTLVHGICKISAVAFGTYGVLLCGPLKKLKEGYRFGQLALSAAKSLGAEEWLSSINRLVYSSINHWRDPLHKSLDPLLYAYEIGMQTGAIEDAMFAAANYCMYYVFSGMPLSPVEQDMRSYNRQMVEYKQDAPLVLLLPTWQKVLNLMGHADDPLKLTGEAMDQEKMLKHAMKKRNTVIVKHVNIVRMELAYYFGQIESAADLAVDLRKQSNIFSNFGVCRFTFFFGLISLEMAKKMRKRQWAKKSRRAIKELEKWAESTAVNTLHMLLLLKAEHSSFRERDRDTVKKAYDTAISTAGRNGFIHDQALANERAAIFFLDNGDDYWAPYYFSRSHELYSEWGAHAKADFLRDKYASMFKPRGQMQHCRGHRGRSRFIDKSLYHKSVSFAELSHTSK